MSKKAASGKTCVNCIIWKKQEGGSMFHFDTQQKMCEIGGARFGGQPGEYPTVVVPSIFQKGTESFKWPKEKKDFMKDV
jgi:hypothetical protein